MSQLGLGHNEDENQPRLIEALSRSGMRMSMMAAGGDLSLGVSENGDAFAWPIMKNELL